MTIHVGATMTTPVSSWVKVPDAGASAAVPGATTAAMANAADAAPEAGAAGEISIKVEIGFWISTEIREDKAQVVGRAGWLASMLGSVPGVPGVFLRSSILLCTVPLKTYSGSSLSASMASEILDVPEVKPGVPVCQRTAIPLYRGTGYHRTWTFFYLLQRSRFCPLRLGHCWQEQRKWGW